MKIKLNKDFNYSYDGHQKTEHKADEEITIDDSNAQILIARGDACECKKEEKVEPKIEKPEFIRDEDEERVIKEEEEIEEPKESPKEPEENKMVKVEENKASKKTKKAKKK